MHTQQKIIAITKNWLTESVIKHQFCPYAKKPYIENAIEYVVFNGVDPIRLLEEIAQSCLHLDQTTTETTLIITANPDYLTDFYDYLDMLAVVEAFLDKPRKYLLRFTDAMQNAQLPKTWADTYQIASFHPDYVFADADDTARENFTNRSPYPMFHILRNDSIEEVHMTDAKAEYLTERNCAHITSLPQAEFDKLRDLAKP